VERRESELWSVAVCPARGAMSVTFQRGSVGRPSGAGKPVANPLGFPEDAGILPCFTNQNDPKWRIYMGLHEISG